MKTKREQYKETKKSMNKTKLQQVFDLCRGLLEVLGIYSKKKGHDIEVKFSI
jgi:hypothetical protein